MARHYRKYKDQDIINAVNKVKTMADLLKLLGLKPTGGNYANMKRRLQKMNIDADHWTGQAWNKGQRLKNWSEYSKVHNLKPHLIKLRTHKCEVCELTEWRNHSIPLEVHHKDGNRTNNELENLQLLCCNCHAATDNWRNKKK
jgi:hypothetical protein